MASPRTLTTIRPPDLTDDEGEAWRCDNCKLPAAPNDLHVTLDMRILCDICVEVLQRDEERF